MKDIIIIGAGGFGRELLQWIKDINKVKPTWTIKGFIDDNLGSLAGIECDYKVLGTISDWVPSDNEVFALAIANPKTKEKIVGIMKQKGAKFVDVIHPTAKICDFSEHGEGLIMYPHSMLCPNSKVGNYVTLLFSGIPHDAIVEDYVTISSYCGLTRGVHIGERAYLADHASVLPEKTIGNDAYVGMGSVVVRNVPVGKKVFGNPAKIIDI